MLISPSAFPDILITTDLRGKTLVNPNPDYFEYFNSLPIVDSTFTNVYSNNDGTFFYTKEKGIVGLEYGGELYRYKRTYY